MPIFEHLLQDVKGKDFFVVDLRQAFQQILISGISSSLFLLYFPRMNASTTGSH